MTYNLSTIDNVLLSSNGKLSTVSELYTSLFHLGEGWLQKCGEYRRKGGQDFKGNGMLYINEAPDFSGRWKRYLLLEDELLKRIAEIPDSVGTLVNAVSYYGRKKDISHADRFFGFIFDLDGVGEKQINNLMFGMSNSVYPMPNFICPSKSGKGIHLYYVLEEPARLYPQAKLILKQLKWALTRELWNQYTSTIKEPQYQSYDQSFRIPRRVYQLSTHAYTLQELNDYIPFSEIDIESIKDRYQENTMSLREAMEKYPEWYERRIVCGEPRKHWICKRDLYDWWKRQIIRGAAGGHRYWCIMMLAIYAIKSGVSYKELEKDAYELQPILSARANDPFTLEDVKSALQAYDEDFATFPINDIEKLSGINIPRNKRNGRDQKTHLKRIRAMQAVDYPDGEWRNISGAPIKEKTVKEWRKQNPEGKKVDCIRDTGLSKPTVYKWWD